MIFYIYHKKEMETLKLNSTGPLVELVQHVLKNLGLFYSNIDGIYGMQTQRAVMRFQTDWGLSTDGIVGQNTWAAFMPYINGYTVHPIRVGDTFFTLAQQYGTTISSIIFANPNSNPNNLYIGQKIIVPFGKIVPTNISYSSEILNLNLNALSRVYPFLEISNMGKSVLGKNIPVIKIGNGSKQVFYSAAIHANEWITSPLLMDFLENLCEAYVNNFRMRGLNIRNILENTTLFIAPMVNPDGVDLVTGQIKRGSKNYLSAQKIASQYPDIPFPSGWKANIKGVDFKNLQPFCKILNDSFLIYLFLINHILIYDLTLLYKHSYFL